MDSFLNLRAVKNVVVKQLRWVTDNFIGPLAIVRSNHELEELPLCETVKIKGLRLQDTSTQCVDLAFDKYVPESQQWTMSKMCFLLNDDLLHSHFSLPSLSITDSTRKLIFLPRSCYMTNPVSSCSVLFMEGSHG